MERLFAQVAKPQEAGGRYEYKDENFQGMAQLGCIIIPPKSCLQRLA
jgi:hypothetical protein